MRWSILLCYDHMPDSAVSPQNACYVQLTEHLHLPCRRIDGGWQLVRGSPAASGRQPRSRAVPAPRASAAAPRNVWQGPQGDALRAAILSKVQLAAHHNRWITLYL